MLLFSHRTHRMHSYNKTETNLLVNRENSMFLKVDFRLPACVATAGVGNQGRTVEILDIAVQVRY